MYSLILIVHILVAVLLVTVVLVQRGKGASIGAAFGSGASQTVFGSQGSGTFLFKLTGLLAALFFISTLTLGYMAASRYHEGQQGSLSLPVSQQAPGQTGGSDVDSDNGALPPLSS